MKKIIPTLVALLSIVPLSVTAQTCSCASVPLLGSMGLASPNDKQWFLASTYEYHDISDLVSGSSSVPDQTGRNRTSQAFILEVSRGLSEEWSISALISAVDHKRSVSGSGADASGLGDAIIMLKYAPTSISLYSDTTLSFGVGSRLPIGEDNILIQGVTLAEDMQPSTGAYASIIWAYWARALNESKGARVYASTSYMQNGDNDRDYQFGHESTVIVGGSYQTQTPWALNLELIYRTAERDRRNSVAIPNTGGEWLDIVPTIQYHVTETMALAVAAKIPLTRDLNDALQFTTKYAFRLSLSWVFGDNG